MGYLKRLALKRWMALTFTALSILTTDASAQAVGRRSTASALSAIEIADLAFMREEEKLAHDVYAALGRTWPTPVFSNIARSESRHMAAILSLLLRYRVTDPAHGLAAGVFQNSELQALYDKLMASGMVSEVAALKVGALIEETDIADLQARMARTQQASILNVYGTLLCGSRNHLRAFNTQLDMRGVTYEPQVISAEAWAEIAHTPHERCGLN